MRVRRTQFGTRASLAALLLTTGLGLAACGDDDEPSPTGSATAGAKVLGPENVATGTPVKVGLANAEDGAAISRPENRIAVEATVDYVNNHLGGLNGHPIELSSCKDKTDNSSAVACANRFVEEGVAAVIVGEVTNADLYVPILQSAGIPWINVNPSGAEELTSPVAFQLSGGTTSILTAVPKIAKERGVRSAVVLALDTPSRSAMLETQAVPTFEAAGIDLDTVLVTPGAPDVSAPVALAMKDSPDLVFVIADPAMCQAVLPAIQLATTGKKPEVVVGAACASPALVDAVGPETVEGAIAVAVTASLNGNPEADLFNAIMNTYADGTTAADNGTGAMALLGLARAVNQVKPSGDLTAQAVIDAMGSAVDVPMPGYPAGSTFTCNHEASAQLTSLCSTSTLYATVEDGVLAGYTAVD